MDREDMIRNLMQLAGSTESSINIWGTYPLSNPREIRRFLVKDGYQLMISTTIIQQEQTLEYRNIFIDTLHSEKHTLRKPIPISIEHTEDIYLASNYDLGLYGYGDTEADALDDLRKSIVECYEDLKIEKDLGPIPSKMLAYYREIIIEK